MGLRGPQAASAEQAIREGKQPCRIQSVNIDVPEGKFECPSWLNQTARDEWQRLLPHLEKLGFLKPMYQTALAVYCEAYAEYVMCVSNLKDKHDYTYLTAFGKETASPLVTVKIKAADRMVKAAAQFGLSPAMFKALGIAAPKQKSEKSKFFERDGNGSRN